MKTYGILIVAVIAVGMLLAEDTLAQRGGRGGGRGGGMSRGGGGMNRSMGASRSPSMSRSMPSPNRSFSNPQMSRPSGQNFSSMNRPGSSNMSRGNFGGAGGSQFGGSQGRAGSQFGGSQGRAGSQFGGSQGRAAASNAGRTGNFSNSQGRPTPGAFKQPSSNQLNNFLNMPSGSGGSATRNRTATNNSAARRQTASNSGSGPQTKTVEGRRGGSIEVTKGAGSGQSGGVGYAGAGKQVTVTGPGGNSKTKTKGVGAASDGTNKVAGAGSRTDIQGAAGGSASFGRGARAATDGTNTAVARGAGGVAESASGYKRGGAVGGVRATDGVNSYARGGSIRAAQNPWGSTVVHGRGAAAYNGVVVGARQATAVRVGYHGYGRYYNSGWYGRYPNAWRAATTAAIWTAAVWGSASTYCGCESVPISYDYGESVYVEDGTVYDGDQPIATQEEYYDQAVAIAEAGTGDDAGTSSEAGDDADWMPLGVFGIVTDGQKTPEKSLQLALSKEGVIRGNLIDEMTGEPKPIQGSVDKESQRVAISLVDDTSVVAEMGLYDLTEDTLTMMIHRGKDDVATRGLVRLTPPDEKGTSSDE